MKYNPSKYPGVWLPGRVQQLLLTKSIGIGEALVLAHIARMTKKGSCWSPNKYLANVVTELSVKQIEHITKKLKDSGLIRVVSRGRKREFFLSGWMVDN